MMIRSLCAAGLLIGVAIPSAAQKTAISPAPLQLSYADVADLALPAPVIAQVRIRKAERLTAELAGNVAAPARRYLVTAEITALIRGLDGMPPRITYVADLRPDARGKWPKLEKAEVILFARPVAGRPSQLRLAAPDAQQPASPALAALVRGLLKEAESAGAPPRIRGVGEAFHVESSVPGEAETQIFLDADDGRPLSFTIWRSPCAPPRWVVSIGEIVDEAAAPPARDTLLWYRLACFLPERLPPKATQILSDGEARAVAEDYATVIAGLGPCRRTRDR